MAISISKATIVSSIDTGLPAPSEDTTIGNYSIPSAVTSSSDGGASLNFSDSLFDSGWSEGGGATGRIVTNPTNDVIDFDSRRTTNGTSLYHDLGAVISDTDFTLRFKLRFSALNDNPLLNIGLSSTTGDDNESQDFLGLYILHQAASKEIHSVTADASALASVASETWTPAISTDYYFQIKRTSATNYTVNAYSDAAFSVPIITEMSNTIAATITGLRYIKIMDFETGVSDGVGIVGTIDDIDLDYVQVQAVANIKDDDTDTFWQSNSETNPNVYMDCDGVGNLQLIGCALRPHANNTETEFLIQTSTDAVAWTTRGTIQTLTAGTWIFVRFNLATARYIRIYGNSGNSVIMAIAEIKYKSDANFPSDHVHNDISTTTIDAGVSTA